MIDATRLSLLASAFAGAFAVAGCAALGLDPGSRLIGEWQVVEIGGRPVVPNSRVTLAFDKEGRLSGNTACNGFGTQYTLNGERIRIPRPVMTLRGCAPALMDQEGRLITLLEQASSYRIDRSGTLVLRTDSNQTLTARPR